MDDKQAMRGALALAQCAAAAGDVPVGAVVLDASGAVIGRGYNTREVHGDPLAHAEILAMRQAAEHRASALGAACSATADSVARAGGSHAAAAWNLADCTLVVTLEPCPMCAGACLQTHIGRIVFGAWDSKLGACGSVWDIPRDPHIGHSPEIYGGVLERESAMLLAEFFAPRR